MRINKLFSRTIVTGLLLTVFYIAPSHAQVDVIGNFMKAGANDASLLTQEYLKPFATGFSTGLNTGLTETAKPKGVLGFSVQLRSGLSIVPSDFQSFNINDLGLQKLRVASGESPITPTVAGESKAGPKMEIWEGNNKLGDFDMPKGLGVPYVPAPMVQASVGLIFNTEITARFVPKISLKEYGEFSLLGGSIKHGLNQYLPGGKIIPVDISVMLGFNSFNMDASLDLQPENGTPRDSFDPNSKPNPDFGSQEASTSVNTFVANVLVGKTLPFISVYGGVGYQTGTFEASLDGDYPVTTYNPIQGNTYSVISDPFTFKIDSDSNIHALAGFRVKLGLFAFYGEAMAADYFTVNAGIGVSFR